MLVASHLLILCSLTGAYLHPGTYHAGNGIDCNLCPPGTYLQGNCNSSTHPTSDCQPCKLGIEFQPYSNAVTTCEPCDTCDVDIRWEIGKNCTATSDTFCQCKAGYYRRSNPGGRFLCMEHSKCEPGEGLISEGDRENNTNCTTCINGSTYWVSSIKPCQSCTNCSTELCKPFCMPAKPVTTQNKAGFPDYAIVLIVLGVGAVVVIVVLIVLARNGKGPNCLQNCCRDKSSTSDQENPPESDRFLPNGQTHDDTDVGAQQSNQSTSQVPVSAQQTGH